MNFIGNLFWVILGGGIFLFFEYLVGGLLLCLTIIGLPFGIQCIRLAFAALFPFGKQIITKPSVNSGLSLLMNILWIVLGGIWIAITHLVFAVICAITIVGLPFAKQHLKLMELSFTPFGKQVV